jgi:hypothetical protein
MSPKLFFFQLLLLPLFLHAQESERHSDVVILPQELNEQYQSLKTNLAETDGQSRKIQDTREEIKKRYPKDHEAPDLLIMLKQLDQQELQIENNRKDWKEKMAGVEEKIKTVILSAHGRQVEWRTYNANPIDKLGTVITTIYTFKDDHVEAVDIYDQLPVPEKH